MTTPHSTAQFSFNRTALPALKVAANAALIADELWKEWSWLDHVADMAGYDNPALNTVTESAHADYRAFVDAYFDDACHVPAPDGVSVCACGQPAEYTGGVCRDCHESAIDYAYDRNLYLDATGRPG